MTDQIRLITAAGGNGTAIKIIKRPLTREEYEVQGRVLGERLELAGAEQAGFLVLNQNHFEMAGGEFCGNATRSAAVLLSQTGTQQENLSFTVSGFSGKVHATVEQRSSSRFFVHCEFPGLSVNARSVILADGNPATIVDLGGIVHVVVEADFPKDPADYEQAHASIMSQFGLASRAAVGVIWCRQTESEVHIDPVVWVRAVNTFFYETSCGSGTIAAGYVTGATSVVQLTGQSIQVGFTSNGITLASEMEVVQ